MGTATEDRQMAAHLPQDDVIAILLKQHAQIKELFDEVEQSTGQQKHDAFEELRGLLVTHETAEEMILRPVTEDIAAEGVAEARNQEEQEANEVLKRLESMDVSSPDFAKEFTALHVAVEEHADAEEREEFTVILQRCDVERRAKMGKRVLAAEKVAPTRPHPSTAGSRAKQWTVGPFTALIDRARDAIDRAKSDGS